MTNTDVFLKVSEQPHYIFSADIDNMLVFYNWHKEVKRSRRNDDFSTMFVKEFNFEAKNDLAYRSNHFILYINKKEYFFSYQNLENVESNIFTEDEILALSEMNSFLEIVGEKLSYFVKS